MPVVTLDYSNVKIEDAFLDFSRPSTPTPDASTLDIYSGIGLMKFDMGMIPNNAKINSAILQVQYNGQRNAKVEISEVLDEWNERTTTFSNGPRKGQIVSQYITPGNSARIDIDVALGVQSQVDGKSYGFHIVADTTSSIVSSNHYTTDYRPKLIINYTIPTDRKQVERIGTTTAKSASNILGSPVNINIPNGVAIGDILVLSVQHNGSTLNIPNGWTLLESPNSQKNTIVYKRYDGNNNPVLLTFTGSVFFTAFISAFRNVKDLIHLGSSVSVTYATPGIVNNVPINSLVLVSYGGFGGGYTLSIPPNFILEGSDFSGGSGSNSGVVATTYNYNKTTYLEDETKIYINGNAPTESRAIALIPITNAAPSIDGQDEFIGAFPSVLKKSYTVTDAEGDNVTIVEKVNGRILANKTGAGDHLLDLSSLWDQLPLGKHRVTVETNDDYNNPPHTPNIRTWDFIKLLSPNAEEEKVIQGVGDAANFMEGMKRKLSEKVNGNEGDKFEQLIEKIRKISEGSTLSSADRKSFVRNSGVAVNESYITIDTAMLGFKPKHIVIWPADKSGLYTLNWFDTDFYRNGSEYANYMGYNYGYRVPYASRMEIPVPTTTLLYNWIAIG